MSRITRFLMQAQTRRRIKTVHNVGDAMQANHLPLLQDSRPSPQDHADRAAAVLRLRGYAHVLGLAEEDRAGHCAAQKGGVRKD
jgi:hypothetical protein